MLARRNTVSIPRDRSIILEAPGQCPLNAAASAVRNCARDMNEFRRAQSVRIAGARTQQARLDVHLSPKSNQRKRFLVATTSQPPQSASVLGGELPLPALDSGVMLGKLHIVLQGGCADRNRSPGEPPCSIRSASFSLCIRKALRISHRALRKNGRTKKHNSAQNGWYRETERSAISVTNSKGTSCASPHANES